jgi:hypothetical protein
MSGVTRASQVALPVEPVALTHMKTVDGAPVVVLCEAVNEMKVYEVLGLPGLRTKGMDEPADTPEGKEARAKFLITLGPLLLPLGTSLAGDDGGPPIRPAFHFEDGDGPAGALPGRLLRVQDIVKMVVSILQLSGFGGAAEGAEFPDGEREGRSDSGGAVAAVEGVGADPLADV